MVDIIEFPSPKESQPEADCVTVIVEDGNPVNWFKFACSFKSEDDQKYCFDIWARDFAHAERQMASLRMTATVDGQVFAGIPA